MATPIITLTTDFGRRDPYVAAMKGVIRAICPEAMIDDLSHEIAPQDLREAAYFLAAAAPSYPPGACHVAVIDPGVGTARRPVALRAGGHYIVAPDNGLCTEFLRRHPLDEARVISNPRFHQPVVSATFHGRDIFAPAAAQLMAGAPFDELGEAVTDLAALDCPRPEILESGRINGEVVHIDHYGNCVTNIHASQLDQAAHYQVQVGSTSFDQIRTTYGEVDSGSSLALIGSTGHLEIAVREGAANDILRIPRGASVTLYRR